jgi:hypothetical protein
MDVVVFSRMSKVEQIEAEIVALTPHEVWTLDGWLAEHKAGLWDEEMARDAQPGGPLDRLAKKAIEDFHAGRTTRLP